MLARVTDNLYDLATLRWLAGPIFDKELRVSSRRKRTFILRTVYAAALSALFVGAFLAIEDDLVWSSPFAAQSAQMSEAVLLLVTLILWFQFIVLPVVASLVCGSAISAEIARRTLGVLMTTPIEGRHVVAGKLLSRLLQVFGLLALSLPLLTIVRVFGGIPWDYIVAVLCITLTTTLFVGSLTILMSAIVRRPFVIVFLSLLSSAFLFGLLPFLGIVTWGLLGMLVGGWSMPDVGSAMAQLWLINPYVLMMTVTELATNPWAALAFGTGQSGPPPWPIHCLIMSAAAAAMLRQAACRVRPAALAAMTHRPRRKQYKVPHGRPYTDWLFYPIFVHALVKRFLGAGLIWKEFLSPLVGRFRRLTMVVVAVSTGLLIYAYIASLFMDLTLILSSDFAGFVGFLLSLPGVFLTLIVPATCITSEKESLCWPILLATTLTDRDILTGKIIGVLRRGVVGWLPLLLFLGLMARVGVMTWSVALQLAAAVAVACLLMIAVGMYFSARCRNSTAAVIAAAVTLGLVWVLPLVLALVGALLGVGGFSLQALCMSVYRCTPLGLASEVVSPSREFGYLFPPTWACWFLFPTIHGIAAAGLLWRAKRRLRRNIF